MQGKKLVYVLNRAGKLVKVALATTLDLEDGTTLEMRSFDTLPEALEYIVLESGTTYDLTFRANTPAAGVSFFECHPLTAGANL